MVSCTLLYIVTLRYLVATPQTLVAGDVQILGFLKLLSCTLQLILGLSYSVATPQTLVEQLIHHYWCFCAARAAYFAGLLAGVGRYISSGIAPLRASSRGCRNLSTRWTLLSAPTRQPNVGVESPFVVAELLTDHHIGSLAASNT